MTIVQNIDFKTKHGLIVKAEIEKINDNKFLCNINADNAEGSFYTVSSSECLSAIDCFKKLFTTIQDVIYNKYNSDTLEKIDNICNCNHLSQQEEEKIINIPSVQILVNGL